MPWIVFVWCLAFLSSVHIYRQYTDYGGWSLDSTTYLMPLVSKMSSLGYCIGDGGQPKDSKLTDRQKEKAISEIPKIHELIGYISVPMGCLMGPFFDFKDYQNFIEEKEQYQSIPFQIVPAL